MSYINSYEMILNSSLKRCKKTARALADLDVLCSLALVGYEENYICPTIVMNGQINIRDGRHPDN